MSENSNFKKASKYLALLLRHAPEAGNITLDAQGWTSVPSVLEAFKAKGFYHSVGFLQTLVDQDDKNRYMMVNNKIRANQGHSLFVDLKLEPIEPPAVLFHGTVSSALGQIFKEGLKKMKRQYVHLSYDMQTATKVGARRGNPLILAVQAYDMFGQGYEFYRSENGVWLTDHVPAKFLYGPVDAST